MRIILAHLLYEFNLVTIQPSSDDWLCNQKIFFLWEKPPLNVHLVPLSGKKDI